ncbi:MAG TPA: class I SAM-dependent methyltransferase [Pyrinomonadaceae bacterium]|nr:class I SAM-dependent methyltransferase [Pyrinomonadaceae bacterium]
MYRERRVVGRSGKVFENVGALSTVNNLLHIRSLMLESSPERTLEIGMAFGGSTLTFAATHRDLQRTPRRQHTAIDHAQKSYWDDAGRQNLERDGLADYVEVIEQHSAFALPQMIVEQRRYDLIYVDGSHQFEDVLIDFVFCHELLNVGGMILFDDSTDSQVAKVLRFIESNYDEIYRREPLLRGNRKERLKRRLARRLHRNQLTAYRKLRDGRQNWGKRLKPF